jgi:DNA-3-methyladenine glycosylase
VARLTRPFYRRPALTVARDLLGRVLCRRVEPRRVLRGRIVEVEAYDGPDDRASHAHRGPTPRNAPMFRAGGIAYVYLIYGVHHCLNVVTGPEGYPAAVLVRAVDLGGPSRSASGPGRLTRRFGIGKEHDGVSLLARDVWLETGDPVADDRVLRTPRIGVEYAGPWAVAPYRFVIDGHRSVSGPARLRSSSRGARRARERRG